MPEARSKVRSTIAISVAMILWLAGAGAYASTDSASTAEIARIVSPPLNEVIAPLESLILVKINRQYSGKDYKFTVYLDREPVDAKWDSRALEYSYFPSHMLIPGDHVVEVYMSQVGETPGQIVAEGAFTVEGEVETKSSSGNTIFSLRAGAPPPRPPAPKPDDFFRFNGRASMSAQFGTVNGPGSGFVQNPENTSIFDLSGYGQTGNTIFNMRFYLTADENGNEQPRNRYSFKVDDKGRSGFEIGDTLPTLSALTMNGLRLRGLNAWTKLGALDFNFAQGEARRGTRTEYDYRGLPIQLGLGARRLWFARMGLWADDPVSLGFSYLSGEEAVSEAPGTGKPGRNTVRSGDLTIRFDGDNGSVKGMIADSDFKSDDPKIADREGDQARMIEGSYAIGGHTIIARWQSIDPGFTSFGLPYIQQDRRGISLEDRLYLLDHTLSGRIFWEQYRNNLDNSLTYTSSITSTGGNLQYRFLKGGPALQVGYTRQNRSNDADPGVLGLVDESSISTNVALTQAFSLWGGYHSLRVDLRNTDGNNAANPSYGYTQKGGSVIVTSRWNSGLQFDLTASETSTDYPGRGSSTDLKRYSVRAGYNPGGRNPNVWAQWEKVKSNGYENTFNSNRDTLQFGSCWFLGKDLSLEGTASLMNFEDYANGANNLSERLYKLILTQILG
jgi:hypothetical protein